MTKNNNTKLTVQHVMGWQDDRLAALIGWINAYANILGHNQEERAIDCIRTAMALEGDFPAYDVNRWFYTTLSLIFYELVGILQKEANTKQSNFLKKFANKFAPETDYTASCFGNCFDSIDFEQERAAIIMQARKLTNG